MFMIMKALIFCIVLIIVTTTVGQSQDSVTSKVNGVYFGGQYYGESMNAIGYYYFKSDSSFIFIRPGMNKNKNSEIFKDRFNDTLLGYGKGRWYLQKNSVILKFDEISEGNVQNGRIEYNGYSKSPYDSLFLEIAVTNRDQHTLGGASILFPSKNLGSATNIEGVSKTKIAKSVNPGTMLITKPGYLDMLISIPNHFNFHEFSITLAKSDDSYIDLVSKFEYSVKSHYEKKKLIFDEKLKKQNEGREKLIQIVKNSEQKYLRQKTLLQTILNELN